MAPRGKKAAAGSSSSRLGWGLLAGFLLLLLVSLGLRHGHRLGEFWDGWRRDAVSGDGGSLARGQAELANPDTAPSEPVAAPSDESLRLQILNATGLNDLALETGEALRGWGVDALDRGNAPAWPFPETLLIQRGRRHEAVADLARRLGGIPVILQRREDLVLDATLVLGQDWQDYRWPGSAE